MPLKKHRGLSGQCVIGTMIGANGYARVKRNGKHFYAHRVAWEKEHGPIPVGYVVHHRCENTACINVGHLELLTKGAHTTLHHLKLCGHNDRRIRKNGWSYCHTCLMKNRRKSKGVLSSNN